MDKSAGRDHGDEEREDQDANENGGEDVVDEGAGRDGDDGMEDQDAVHDEKGVRMWWTKVSMHMKMSMSGKICPMRARLLLLGFLRLGLLRSLFMKRAMVVVIHLVTTSH